MVAIVKWSVSGFIGAGWGRREQQRGRDGTLLWASYAEYSLYRVLRLALFVPASCDLNTKLVDRWHNNGYNNAI